MTKGKYAQRADSRLKVLESEALRDATAKIESLKDQLAQANHQLHIARSDIQSKAMQAASVLSSREKKHLRDKLASAEQHMRDERMRMAVLSWEHLHRKWFGEPSPKADVLGAGGDENVSRRLWFEVKWLLAAIFFPDYDEAQQFIASIEGEWGIAGWYGHTARENTRWMRKGGLRNALAKRHDAMRAYWRDVYRAHNSKTVEPVKDWKYWKTLDDDEIERIQRRLRQVNPDERGEMRRDG